MTTAMNLMRPRRNGNSLTAGDVEVGVDAPGDLAMLTEADWPKGIKVLHKRKIEEALSKNRV